MVTKTIQRIQHASPASTSPLVQGTMKSAESLPHFRSTAAVNSLVDLQTELCFVRELGYFHNVDGTRATVPAAKAQSQVAETQFAGDKRKGT